MDVVKRLRVCIEMHGIQSKRPTVKTSHSQNVPLFRKKRPRWLKRPESKRTNVNELMQWLHSVTDCAVVIYTAPDCEV